MVQTPAAKEYLDAAGAVRRLSISFNGLRIVHFIE